MEEGVGERTSCSELGEKSPGGDGDTGDALENSDCQAERREGVAVSSQREERQPTRSQS